jgi:very-short-patch-repair endonuclease
MFLYCSRMAASPAALRKAARRMRHEPSFNERTLWTLLRNRRLDDLKFRRQVPIGPYIADFVCFAHRLIVEADSPLHDPKADAVRDAWLRSQGFRVLRFPNSRITLYPELVLDEIRATAGAEPFPLIRPFGPPSPARGEGSECLAPHVKA